MIFEVNANQIEGLDKNQLVDLLRRLIQAELNKNSIPLRYGTAPAQITIADGSGGSPPLCQGGPFGTRLTGRLCGLFFQEISAFLAITHAAFSVQQRIKNWEASKSAFVDLRIDLGWLRQDMVINPEFEVAEYEARSGVFRQRYREHMARLTPDTLRTRRLNEKTQIKLNDSISGQIQSRV